MEENKEQGWATDQDAERLRGYLRDERDTVWKLKKEAHEIGACMFVAGMYGVGLAGAGGWPAGLPVALALSALLLVIGGYMWWKFSR
jgi:hypothetical protein